MRRSPLVGVAILAAGLAACGGSGEAPTVRSGAATSSSPSGQSPTTAPPSASASSAAPAIPADITTGQCVVDVENYTVVPCTQTHAYQVTAVVQDTREVDSPTGRQALREATCSAAMTTFSGAAPVGLLATPNPVKLVDDPLNTSRIVCLMRLRTDGDKANVLLNYSLKDKLAGEAGLKYTFCVDTVARNFKVVPCTQPHLGQTTGGYLVGKYEDPFPGTAKLKAERAKRCPKFTVDYLGTGTRSDLRTAGLSTNASAWQQGYRYSACFVEPTSGSLSKSVRGIGTKPLTSYR